MMIKVKNMKSSKGNPVANQFEIRTNDATYFQSYDTIIVKKSHDEARVYLDRYYWDYSVTTGKYRNEFLGEGIAETRKKINSGEYILTDLNNEGGV